MGLLDSVLSAIDNKKRTLKRGVMDMIDNPGDWSNMTAARMKENMYGGPENWDAMKKYYSRQPYDQKLKDAAQQSMINNAVNESLGAVTAWHGSPHKFDKFDMSKIGTGEGAQAYGHGLYLAESPGVAKSYAENLAQPALVKGGEKIAQLQGPQTAAQARFINAPDDPVMQNVMGVLQKHNNNYDDAIKALDSDPRSSWEYADEIDLLKAWKSDANRPIADPGQHLYKVDIPDEAVAKFLDWDKPLSQQAPEVQSAITKAYPHLSEQSWYQGTKRITDPELLSRIESELKIRPSEVEAQGFYKASPLNESWTGQDLLNHLGRKAIGASGEAEKTLNSVGIQGIRYLDGSSRGTGSGTSNYVLFDDQLPRILERNGQPTGLQPWAKGEWKGLLDEPAPKLTEFEQRHLTAQKNAALPVEQGGLGLPPNNTAMDRARAMGFDANVYHGTGADVQEFEKRFLKKDKKTYLYDIGVHGSLSPETANEYAQLAGFPTLARNMSAGLEEGAPVVYPLMARSGNVLDVTKKIPDDVESKILDKGDEFFNSRRRNAIVLKDVRPDGLLQELQPKMGRKPLRDFVTNDLGFDSVKYPFQGENLVVTNPNQLRSRFAAFDPMRRHEADLLGYADPRLLGAIAGGGLLGLGGYSMMNDK